MSDLPLSPAPGPEVLAPLPTEVCPHCSNLTPSGNYCGVCGAHLSHSQTPVAARRPHAFSANPEEPVFRLSVVSTLFPHLSHRTSTPFRAGFALLVGLLVIFAATGLQAPVIALSAMGVPLLFQLYIYEVDVYEKDHLLLAAETLLVGAVLGVGWALVGGPIVAHVLEPSLGGLNHSGFDIFKAAVLVPVVGQALMLVPVLLALVLVPGFLNKRESLDAFTLGAASALGFTFAAIITNLASELSQGLVTHLPFTSLLTQALIRGIATPVLAAAATGLVAASIWVRRSEKGSVAAGGRWLTNPLLVLAAVLVVQIALGFIDQANLTDIPLLFLHLLGTAVVLIALRMGLHHILLHEQHDVTIGPSTVCSNCSHIVPFMPFCPSCGVAQGATTKRQRPRTSPAGADAPDEEGASVETPVGWPTLSPGTSTTWSGFPLAGTPTPRAHRGHQTLLLGVFTSGLAAITVALILTAVAEAPDTTPAHKCRDGVCPGLDAAGTPIGAPNGTYYSKDGHFNVGVFVMGPWGKPSEIIVNSTTLGFQFKAATIQTSKGNVGVDGGTEEIEDVTGSKVSGATAQQIVDSVIQAQASSASLAYAMPDAIVGDVPGYGGVYNYNVNSSNGEQEPLRIVCMAAVQNGVAIEVLAWGPDDASFQSLPLLEHPSFVDLDIAESGLDNMVNSIRWSTSNATFAP